MASFVGQNRAETVRAIRTYSHKLVAAALVPQSKVMSKEIFFFAKLTF
jgi:hypothetical protein